MTQRINIQYTIEIDELEEEVRRIIIKNFTNFETIIQNIKDVLDGSILSHNVLEQLDLARQEMAKVDTRLSDCCSLIDGYLQYKSNLRNENTQAATSMPSEEVEPITNDADLVVLKQRLQKFQNSFDEFPDASNEVPD